MVTNLGLYKILVGLIGELLIKDLLYLYSNSAYINRWGLISTFKSKLIKYIIKDFKQRIFNREIAVLYIIVKYGFSLVTKY
jgi:hypothetical protein